MAAKECFCSRPTRDGFLCETCLNLLDILLAGMEWLDAELATTLTRQRAAATEGGPRSTETPVPFHDGASRRRRELHRVLQIHTRALGGQVAERDTLSTLSARLLQGFTVLSVHDEGRTAWGLLRGLESGVKAARGVIFWKTPPKVYLGRCEGAECACECHEGWACSDPETCQRPGATDRAEACSGEVYAHEDADRGACQECRRGYSVSIKRAEIEAELDAQLYTAEEIADLSAWLDLGVPRDRVRKQINTWKHRKLLSAAPGGAETRFRFGDVKPLLYAYAERKRR